MKNYAQVSGNSVVNIVVAENKEEVELILGSSLVEITEENNAGIGFIYDPETGLFTNPYAVVEETQEEEAPAE